MKNKKLVFKWLLALIPAVAAALMYIILPLFPKFTEYVFSRGIFRIISFPYSWIMSALPFSVTEAAVLLAVPVILALIIFWIVRIVRSSRRTATAEKGIRFAVWCVSLALLIFMLMDGVNFYRIPLGELMELPDREYTAQDLFIVTSDLAERASEARENMAEDEDGCAVLSQDISVILRKADDCYHNLKVEYPFLSTAVWRVKPVLLSHQWSYTGTTGVYCPWLAESNVNVDITAGELPHTAVHEIAHTIGFAKENECNFLAWLACSESGMTDFEYSGHLQAFIYCANALYKADKELWKEAYSNCSAGVRRDIVRQNEYWDSFKGEVMESSQEFNDTFIKANRVESGVLSYDQMVELMLRYYDKHGML